MSHNNIPTIDVFWSLVDKADRKFSEIRDLPLCGRTRFELHFNKVFKIYSRLWKFQQENRQKLVDAGMRRWEIGEIASRIAQLHYNQYLRTSDTTYLTEAHTFYEAIMNREYFKEVSSPSLTLSRKQFRFLARFVMVCLVSNKREMVPQLVKQMREKLQECESHFQEVDFKDWKLLTQDLVRFLKADSSFMNMKPLRYSLVLDHHPESFPPVVSKVSRKLQLREAVLCSYHYNEVKFSELSLDTYRMLQCLEWEPSGSFYRAARAEYCETDFTSATYLPGITDFSLPRNPRKAILYRPTAAHFLSVLAAVSEEVPSDGILLIYLSASGMKKHILARPYPSAISASQESASGDVLQDVEHLDLADHEHSLLTHFHENSDCCSGQNEVDNQSIQCLYLGGPLGNEGLGCIFPQDLIPFTRTPLFLIIDSDNSKAFKALHGAEMGERTAMLLSPCCPMPSIALDDRASFCFGSHFSMFLTVPMHAFCLLLGLSSVSLEKTYWEGEKLLSCSFERWGSILAMSECLDSVWSQALLDAFLRRLLLRFIFCRAVLVLFARTCNHKEFHPDCLPELPEPVLSASLSTVLELANMFGMVQHFVSQF